MTPRTTPVEISDQRQIEEARQDARNRMRDGEWNERMAVTMAERGYGVKGIIAHTGIDIHWANLIVLGVKK
jgi:hypothetical protein